MNAAEKKLDLFRKLDSLKGNRLEEVYGKILNLINSKSEIEEWDNLTNVQKNAIHKGLEQLDNEEGINHEDVMTKLR